MPSKYQQAPPNAKLSEQEKLEWYRTMVRSRSFEDVAHKRYIEGHMGGWLQLSLGQEALAVGVLSLLEKDDHSITSFRHFTQSLAMGMSMNECMAELCGKTTGCSKGKSGSTGMFAPGKNYWGTYPIAGAQVPVATGIAFALKYRAVRGCCVCFLGDGEMNQGAVHEAMNLAALYKLPVVFVIESNGLSFGVRTEAASSFRNHLAERAEAYDIP